MFVFPDNTDIIFKGAPIIHCALRLVFVSMGTSVDIRMSFIYVVRKKNLTLLINPREQFNDCINTEQTNVTLISQSGKANINNCCCFTGLA